MSDKMIMRINRDRECAYCDGCLAVYDTDQLVGGLCPCCRAIKTAPTAMSKLAAEVRALEARVDRMDCMMVLFLKALGVDMKDMGIITEGKE